MSSPDVTYCWGINIVEGAIEPDKGAPRPPIRLKGPSVGAPICGFGLNELAPVLPPPGPAVADCGTVESDGEAATGAVSR